MITAVLLFLATADALPTPKLSWRRPTRHGSFERKHGISVRGGTLPLPDEVELAFDMKLQRFVKQNVKRWSSTVGLFAALCYFFPHLLVDFSSCWHRLVCGGFLVSIALVTLAVPQCIKLSGGILPPPTTVHIIGILLNAMPTQTFFKLVQYFWLRSAKMTLDSVSWMPYKTLNTIMSYGMTASIMQCAAYNNVCWNTYHYHDREKIIFQKHDTDSKGHHTGSVGLHELRGALADAKVELEDIKNYKGDDIIVVLKDQAGVVQLHHHTHGRINLGEFKLLLQRCAKRKAEKILPMHRLLVPFLRTNVVPGILFSFLRECGGTGVGLCVSPHVRTYLAPVIGAWPPVLAKIVSGMIAGIFCSFCTQWLHNNALRAANIYQYSGHLPSTLTVLRQTWAELGMRMFYLNADRRVLSTATATTVLGLVDIFA